MKLTEDNTKDKNHVATTNGNDDDGTVVTTMDRDDDDDDYDDHDHPHYEDENDDDDTEQHRQKSQQQQQSTSVFASAFHNCYDVRSSSTPSSKTSSHTSSPSSSTTPTGLQKRKSFGIKATSSSSPIIERGDEVPISSQSSSSSLSVTILVVDDNLYSQQQQQQLASKRGCRLCCCCCCCNTCCYVCQSIRYIWYRFIGRGVTSEMRMKQYFLLFCIVIGIAVLLINKFDIANHYHELKVQNECNLDSMVVKASNNNYQKSIAYEALQMYIDVMTKQNQVTLVEDGIIVNGGDNNITTTGTTLINSTTTTPTSHVVNVKIIEIHEKTYETFYQLFVPSLSSGLCSYINNVVNVIEKVIPTNDKIYPTLLNDSSIVIANETSVVDASNIEETTNETQQIVDDEIVHRQDANELEDSSDAASSIEDNTNSITTNTTVEGVDSSSSSITSSNIETSTTTTYAVLDVAIDCTKLVRFSPIIYGTGDWLYWYYSMRYIALLQHDTSILFTCTDYALAKDIPKNYILPWLTGWFPASSSTEEKSHDDEIEWVENTNSSNSIDKNINLTSSSYNNVSESLLVPSSGGNDSNTSIDSIETGSTADVIVRPLSSSHGLYDTICNGNIEDKTSNYIAFVPKLILPMIKQDLRRMTVGLIGLNSDPNHPINQYACDQMITASTFNSTGSNVTLSSSNSSSDNLLDDNSSAFRVETVTNATMMIGVNQTIDASSTSTNEKTANTNPIDPMKNVYSVTSGSAVLSSSKIVFDDVIIHFPCADVIEAKISTTSSTSIEEQVDGFYKFSHMTKLISKDAKSIGILTQSLDNNNLVNTFEDSTDARCKRIVKRFVDYITEEFQNFYFEKMSLSNNDTIIDDGIGDTITDTSNEINSNSSFLLEPTVQTESMVLPTITIYDDSHDMATIAVARMIMANQSIASASKLSIMGSMATFGTAYIPKANVVEWLQLPPPPPIVGTTTTTTSEESIIDGIDDSNRRRILASIVDSPEEYNVRQRHRSKTYHHYDSSTVDEWDGGDVNSSSADDEYYHRHYNHNHVYIHNDDETNIDLVILDEYGGTIEIVDSGLFLPMDNVTSIWKDPDGENILLEWFLNDTFYL